jgi:hypothetical protein
MYVGLLPGMVCTCYTGYHTRYCRMALRRSPDSSRVLPPQRSALTFTYYKFRKHVLYLVWYILVSTRGTCAERLGLTETADGNHLTEIELTRLVAETAWRQKIRLKKIPVETAMMIFIFGYCFLALDIAPSRLDTKTGTLPQLTSM